MKLFMPISALSLFYVKMLQFGLIPKQGAINHLLPPTFEPPAGQEIGLEEGTANFHKIRAPSSFFAEKGTFYWSL
jgi:hypothetical protein